MKRQRGKAELLRQRQIYEAMVHDAQDEHNIRGGSPALVHGGRIGVGAHEP
jgi:hypothetical protein